MSTLEPRAGRYMLDGRELRDGDSLALDLPGSGQLYGAFREEPA